MASEAEQPNKSKNKPRPRATVEEVEESGDESDGQPFKELPFRNVPPVEHVQPGESLPRKPAGTNKSEKTPEVPEKAYEVRTELDDPKALVETLKQILDQPVLVKLKYLLGVSPALQKGMKSKTSKSRKYQSKQGLDGSLLAPKVQNFSVRMVMETAEEDAPRDPSSPPRSKNSSTGEDSSENESVDEEEAMLAEDAIDLNTLPYDGYAMIMTQQVGDLEEGSVVMDDPVLQYLDSLAPGERPRQVVYTGLSSAALRCLYPQINGNDTCECIMDSGSQIVSMHQDEAIRLRIPWNPDVQILMQSANGQVEKTLGLARNIPFLFGDIIVHLQVHILPRAPYKALLGRPFEILTESVIRNTKEGHQTVTMTDPYSGHRTTIPSHERGRISVVQRPPYDRAPGVSPGRGEQNHPKTEAVPSSDSEDF